MSRPLGAFVTPAARAARAELMGLFEAALGAVDAGRRLAPLLPPPPRRPGRLVVVGAGKAAAAMAVAAAARYGPAVPGVVATRHGHGVRPGESAGAIRVIEAGHPMPDAAALEAADAVLTAVAGLRAGDTVICLLSGGGSALLERPLPGLDLAGLRAINAALLRSGAAIGEINIVRKHLSAIKGGRLARAAWPARLEAFAVSDAPGDDPAAIASGPTLADPSTCADALAIVRRLGLSLPPALETALEEARWETPKPGDPRLARSRLRLIATATDMLAAAARAARARGLDVVDLGAAVEGEAALIAASHARAALEARRRGGPVVILSGGELTVTMTPGRHGSGGPSREYALAVALALGGAPGIWALAADTDGIDGAADAAGAVIGPDTLARLARLGLDAPAALRGHDSGAVFAALGDALVTGPTRTNVSDFRAILVNYEGG